MRALVALVVLLITSPVYAQSSGSSSGASAVINMSDPASVTNRLVTTPSLVAPGLTAAGVETCLGSASGGLSLMGGGFMFGGTTVDEGCTIRLLARQLYAFGFQKAALALMCEDEHVVTAMYAAGSPCPARLFAAVGQPSQVSFAPERVLRSIFATVSEPSQDSAAQEQIVRKNGVD
jgi:hypothetical protein